MPCAAAPEVDGNPRVAAFFGWEGSSVEHGGYINRGFDDIGWLPNKGGR